MISWRELEAAAPQIAQPGRQRFELTRVALLGTLRKDGSPRISPVEPYLSEGLLLFGAMSWSLKVADLMRDGRCVLHSPITAPDHGEVELKLYGCAMVASDEIRNGCARGWWQGRSMEAAVVFTIGIDQATLIEWDLLRGEMLVRRWSAAEGLTETSRGYP